MTTQSEPARTRPTRTAFFLGVLFLAGLYLVLSPWVIVAAGQVRVGFVNVITGLALMLLTAGFAHSAERLGALAWVVPVLGAWVIAAPWAVYHGGHRMAPMHFDLRLSTATWVNSVVVGAIVLAAGIGLAWRHK